MKLGEEALDQVVWMGWNINDCRVLLANFLHVRVITRFTCPSLSMAKLSAVAPTFMPTALSMPLVSSTSPASSASTVMHCGCDNQIISSYFREKERQKRVRDIMTHRLRAGESFVLETESRFYSFFLTYFFTIHSTFHVFTLKSSAGV